MGFLSKIGKGIKSVFKKVGKGIKGVLKSVGKFMDKIGLVGQIGLALILPGIGAQLGNMWNGLVEGMKAYQGFGSSVVKAAGGFLKTATNVASGIGKSFSSISEGIVGTVGETLKVGAQKLGLGDLATKMGFESLGTSINSASFDSISAEFGKITDVFARNPAGITPSKGITVGEGGELPMTEPMTDAQVAKANATAIDAVPQDSLLSQPAQRGVTIGPDTLPDTLDTMATDFEAQRQQALADLPSVGEQEGFIKKTVRGVTEGVTKEAKEFIADPGGTIVGYGKKALVEGVESGAKTGAATFTLEKVFNVDTTPDVQQSYYGTYTPSIDYTIVESAQPSGLLNFMNQNQEFINTHPFGATAAVVENFYPQLLKRTQAYGG